MMTIDQLAERLALARTSPMRPILPSYRDEFAVALVLQGYDLSRAHRMAFEEIEDNDGVLQMLARHHAAVEAHALLDVVRENGPVVIDAMGDGNLAWRPLDYGTWTLLSERAKRGEVAE